MLYGIVTFEYQERAETYAKGLSQCKVFGDLSVYTVALSGRWFSFHATLYLLLFCHALPLWHCLLVTLETPHCLAFEEEAQSPCAIAMNSLPPYVVTSSLDGFGT
ncbi:hypothetical protein OCU04_009645 [Sclerotinia nivalis]|uniref:Uncharacterized protein n=1 Tax=Sclerotinia nivalis TaxID=352851 RepID=A0A9X0AGN5_9HELO|nr:hypothetical protein OCU04_009645 [Sclerotinia nivalis]